MSTTSAFPMTEQNMQQAMEQYPKSQFATTTWTTTNLTNNNGFSLNSLNAITDWKPAQYSLGNNTYEWTAWSPKNYWASEMTVSCPHCGQQSKMKSAVCEHCNQSWFTYTYNPPIVNMPSPLAPPPLPAKLEAEESHFGDGSRWDEI